MIAAALIIGVIALASVYGVYSLYFAALPSDNPTPTPPPNTSPTSTNKASNRNFAAAYSPTNK